MAILTPCLFMAAIGVVFGAIHLIAHRDDPNDEASKVLGCGMGCGACHANCERRGTDGGKDA